jgi:hypothetical protein
MIETHLNFKTFDIYTAEFVMKIKNCFDFGCAHGEFMDLNNVMLKLRSLEQYQVCSRGCWTKYDIEYHISIITSYFTLILILFKLPSGSYCNNSYMATCWYKQNVCTLNIYFHLLFWPKITQWKFHGIL